MPTGAPDFEIYSKKRTLDPPPTASAPVVNVNIPTKYSYTPLIIYAPGANFQGPIDMFTDATDIRLVPYATPFGPNALELTLNPIYGFFQIDVKLSVRQEWRFRIEAFAGFDFNIQSQITVNHFVTSTSLVKTGIKIVNGGQGVSYWNTAAGGWISVGASTPVSTNLDVVNQFGFEMINWYTYNRVEWLGTSYLANTVTLSSQSINPAALYDIQILFTNTNPTSTQKVRFHGFMVYTAGS